jgi:hypothetical protein
MKRLTPCAAGNPAIALWLLSNVFASRVAELGLFFGSVPIESRGGIK